MLQCINTIKLKIIFLIGSKLLGGAIIINKQRAKASSCIVIGSDL